MSLSEKLVDGLAVTFVFLGFISGVIAEPINKAPHATTVTTHPMTAHSQSNQDARRAISHA
ncbi:MAG: hypothetical protein JO172_04310 [Hyphomicrobiales bacterium]|nr:hypothetical protein [Hyphomicrobiales bacterium]